MVWLNFKLIILRSAVTYVASNKYLINCLVLVQPDFEINEILNRIIIVLRGVGSGGRGLPLNGDVWSF